MRQAISSAIYRDGETVLTMASAYGSKGWMIGERVCVRAPDGRLRPTTPLRDHWPTVLMADGRSGVVVIGCYVASLASGDFLERMDFE